MSCNNTNSTCTNCNHNYSSCNNKCAKCGCKDSFLTSPPPCPTPAGCPDPIPCQEVLSSDCIIYTSPNILCNTDIVVYSDSTLTEILEDLVNYFCNNGGGGGGIGPTGPQGPAGIQGIQGVMGLTGPQGIPGSSGGAGATGATGPQGAQGIPGPVGPAGLNWQGSWSALGVYVPDDAVGFNGASWFCLNAVGPSASNPLIDPANWALLASEGAVGPAGPTGPAGVAGAAGATGPQGPIGLTGSQGIQGITGPTGAQGIQGIQGIPGTGGTTNIGKKLGGGIVIAEWDENGIQKALIASLTDISSFIEWTVPAFTNTLIGSLAQSYSDGFGNTLAVLSQAGILNTTYAAGAAYMHNGGGYNDWYLPALWELTMCYNAATIVNRVLGVNGFANNNYWSSTEAGVSSAWGQSFFNGAAISNFSKNSNVFVRAVRIHNI